MLSKIWEQQKKYNQRIFEAEGTTDPEYWSKQYLLGLTWQVGEILRGIRWKRNRNENGKKVVKLNILDEIADVLKFTISLAQAWGFAPDEVLNAVWEKGVLLDFKRAMEFRPAPVGRNIIVTDVDGTLADYRKSFLKWLQEKGIEPAKEATSLLLDSALELEYPEYYKLKEEFEESGGYRTLTPYWDSVDALEAAHCFNWYIVATTARPNNVYKRIFQDTLYWFGTNNIPLDELHMVGDGRILLAHELAKNNHVVMLEDDPSLALRAAKSGLKVYLRRQIYNESMTAHENIVLCDNYEQIFHTITCGSVP